MNDYELQSHKKSDKIKWILTGIAFLLVFVLLAGLILQLFGKDELKPSNWGKKTDIVKPDDTPDEEDEGDTVITEETSNGVKLMTTLIAPSDFGSYGISTYAQSAIQIKAVITPANASNQNLKWSCEWENANSTWAKGKNIADYYGQETGAPLTATFACYKPFGEPIRITVTSEDNPNVSATAKADYVKRLTPSFDIGSINNSNFTVLTTLDGSSDFSFRLNETYSDGTVTGTVKYSNFKKVLTDSSGNKQPQVFGDLEDSIYHEYMNTKNSSDTAMDYCQFQYGGITESDDYLNNLINNGLDAFSCWPGAFWVCYSDSARKLSNARLVSAIDNQLYQKFGSNGLKIEISFDYTYTYGSGTYGSGTVTKSYVLDCISLGVPVGGITLNNTTLTY